MKENFNASADGTFRTPENALDPAKVAERDILTRDSLAHMEAQHPSSPRPSYEIADEGIRQAALERTRDEQREEIARLRENFCQRPEKARRDFGTARDYRGADYER